MEIEKKEVNKVNELSKKCLDIIIKNDENEYYNFFLNNDIEDINFRYLYTEINKLEEKNMCVKLILGFMYSSGYEVEKDYKKMLEYYNSSIDEGSILGLMNMSRVYLNGKGVVKDEIKAFEYYEETRKKNIEMSKYIKKDIYKNLSNELLYEKLLNLGNKYEKLENKILNMSQ